MLIEQNFELSGPGPHGRICIPTTSCFHDKTIISKENFRVDCYSLLKYCKRQCSLLPPTSVVPNLFLTAAHFHFESHPWPYSQSIAQELDPNFHQS